MSDVLELSGVSLVRGGKALLDDVDWQVREGERWVVMGPNGAGKTTLLEMIEGLEAALGMRAVRQQLPDQPDLRRLQTAVSVPMASRRRRGTSPSGRSRKAGD